MAYRVLEVTLLSAKDLKRVNLISRMEVYAVVTISGDPLTRQCTQPDPYGGRHPSWNTSFRFNVPPTAATATGCLHVLLRTERALGDRDVGEVIVPLADILAGGGAACDPGARPPQLASYQVRKVHRYEPRGMLNMSYRLGPIVAPQAPPETAAPFVGYPVARSFYGPPYAYLPAAAPLSLLPPPHPQAAGGHNAVHPSPQSAGAISTYNSPSAYPQAAAAGHASLPAPPHPQAAGGHDAVHPSPQSAGAISAYNSPSAYPQAAAAGHASLPPTTRGNDSGGGKQLDFGVGLGAGLVSGAISGILAGDAMMSEAAAYNYGYRAGLADGGAGATVYKKNSHYGVPEGKVEPNRTMV